MQKVTGAQGHSSGMELISINIRIVLMKKKFFLEHGIRKVS